MKRVTRKKERPVERKPTDIRLCDDPYLEKEFGPLPDQVAEFLYETAVAKSVRQHD